MEIRYKNKRIRDICENEKKAIKDVADYQNFRLHELKYGRKGQFAIDLGKTTGYRLIIEPITVNEKNEGISYESINIVEIMEVSNHYE